MPDLPVQDISAERRMRSTLRQMGCTLSKSRRRNTRAADFGGYMILHIEGYVLAGGSPVPYSMDLDDVNAWIDERRNHDDA